MDLKEVRYEAPLTQYLFTKASREKIPLSGTFELSPVCNFSCRMCYVRMTPSQVAAHSRPAMTLERWLEVAEQARASGLLYLLLTGGEPFLWPDFWPLYERLTEMGFVLSINTNGSLIDEAAIARLRARPPTRLNITLYGACDETYRALCRADGVFTQVDRAITRLDPVDGHIRCRAGKAAFWVTWDGWLTPCGMMTEPRVDLAEQPFDRAWHTLTEESTRLRLSGVCGQCPDRDLCHSCAAMAQAETGSPGGIPLYLCRMVEAMKTLARQELDRRGR